MLARQSGLEPMQTVEGSFEVFLKDLNETNETLESFCLIFKNLTYEVSSLSFTLMKLFTSC